MCDPIVSIGLSLVGGVMQYSAQAGAAAASQKWAQQQQTLINENAARTYQTLDERQRQEHTVASQQIQDVRSQAAQARATALVAAGESGVSGVSVNALLRDFTMRENTFVDRTKQGYEWTTAQIMREKDAVKRGAQSQINDTQSQVVQAPSFLDAGLRILTDGYGQYTQYYGTKAKDLSGKGAIG